MTALFGTRRGLMADREGPPSDLTSTTDLLRRAREGDALALDDLYRRH